MIKVEPDKGAMSQPVPVIAPPKIALRSSSRPVDEIIIHCAATPQGRSYTVKDIDAWHRQRGFNGIGYHYVVYLNGTIHTGRPIGRDGAHVKDHNKNTIGVCYIGGVSRDGKTPKDTRTPEQRSSLKWLVGELARINPAIRKISGHNQYAQKACPSFDARKDELGNLPGFKAGKLKT